MKSYTAEELAQANGEDGKSYSRRCGRESLRRFRQQEMGPRGAHEAASGRNEPDQ